MATLRYLEELLLKSRRTYLVAVALTLMVMGITVAVGWLLARTLIRDQISQRDANLLYAATQMEQMDARSSNGAADFKSDEQIGFDAAILASRMKGVMGIRFFDPSGRFTDSFPPTIQPRNLDADTVRVLQDLQAVSVFRNRTLMSDVFIYLPSFATGRVDRIPILEVTVPLHAQDSKSLIGAAQFIVEGQSIAAEFRALDQHLTGLAGQTMLIATGLLGVLLWIVFRRVERLNAQLAAQNRDLARANQELAIAARSSALGAISAHLMHGLKNPLASLSRYVREHSSESNGNELNLEAEDWKDAVAATRRMQALVEHTTEVLSDARGEVAYDLSIPELARNVQRQVSAEADKRAVQLLTAVDTTAVLNSRMANLVQLILQNLVENGIQSTPAGRTVHLRIHSTNGQLAFEVEDEGPGFPAHLRPRLFLPCRSTKEGGSGIGLSLCKQLADHLGATLELQDAPGGGCRFILSLPLPAAPNAPASTISSVHVAGR